MWNGSEMNPIGECQIKMLNPKNNKQYAVNFVVVDKELRPLLGANAIQKMALITVNKE